MKTRSAIATFAVLSGLVLACSSASTENVGNSAAALTPTIVTCTTRANSMHGVEDDQVVHCPSTFGPGGTPGMCWLYFIGGSFRGSSEFAQIDLDANNEYEVSLKSDTLDYDNHDTTVGPEASMACVSYSGLGFSAAQIGNITGNFGDIAATQAPGYGTDIKDSDVGAAQDLIVFSGVNGRLRNLTGCGWPGSENACDRALVSQLVDYEDNALTSQFDMHTDEQESCSVSSACCQIEFLDALDYNTGASGPSWNLTGSSVFVTAATGDQDLGVSGGTDLCKLDGIEGFWDGSASATVEVETDGDWHLVVTEGTPASSYVGAYVSCFSQTQPAP